MTSASPATILSRARNLGRRCWPDGYADPHHQPCLEPLPPGRRQAGHERLQVQAPGDALPSPRRCDPGGQSARLLLRVPTDESAVASPWAVFRTVASAIVQIRTQLAGHPSSLSSVAACRRYRPPLETRHCASGRRWQAPLKPASSWPGLARCKPNKKKAYETVV